MAIAAVTEIGTKQAMLYYNANDSFVEYDNSEDANNNHNKCLE